MKEVFYSIKTKKISTKQTCSFINSIPSNQYFVICFDYEEEGIWVKTIEDPRDLKEKIQKQLSKYYHVNIKLGNPIYESIFKLE